MSILLHPKIVHLPIALAIILPFLIVAFAMMIKSKKMSSQAWLVIIGLQILATATGYASLKSGEVDEEVVEKVVDRKIIHEHEESGEVFVGFTVVALVLSVAAFFLKQKWQFKIQMMVAILSLVSTYFGYDTGRLGGDLVYKHGAGSAYISVRNDTQSSQGLLPTPGKNTSESSNPVEENESLKSDDNDYGNSDENGSLSDDDEDAKLED